MGGNPPPPLPPRRREGDVLETKRVNVTLGSRSESLRACSFTGDNRTDPRRCTPRSSTKGSRMYTPLTGPRRVKQFGGASRDTVTINPAENTAWNRSACRLEVPTAPKALTFGTGWCVDTLYAA